MCHCGLLAGECHTKVPMDLHMEHCNLEAKQDLKSARGLFQVRCREFVKVFTTLGNITSKVVARAGRLKPLKKEIERQLFPKYTERFANEPGTYAIDSRDAGWEAT